MKTNLRMFKRDQSMTSHRLARDITRLKNTSRMILMRMIGIGFHSRFLLHRIFSLLHGHILCTLTILLLLTAHPHHPTTHHQNLKYTTTPRPSHHYTKLCMRLTSPPSSSHSCQYFLSWVLSLAWLSQGSHPAPLST